MSAAQQGARQRHRSTRKPNTALLDVRIGIAWWRCLSSDERTAWLQQTRAASSVDCWNAYKRGVNLSDRVQAR